MAGLIELGQKGFRQAHPGVKVVAIARRTGEPYVLPSRDTVLNRTYPLTRSVFVFVRKDAPAAAVRFVDFRLADAGQRLVAAEGAYLPLPPNVARQQAFILHSLLPY